MDAIAHRPGVGDQCREGYLQGGAKSRPFARRDSASAAARKAQAGHAHCQRGRQLPGEAFGFMITRPVKAVSWFQHCRPCSSCSALHSLGCRESVWVLQQKEHQHLCDPVLCCSSERSHLPCTAQKTTIARYEKRLSSTCGRWHLCCLSVSSKGCSRHGRICCLSLGRVSCSGLQS